MSGLSVNVNSGTVGIQDTAGNSLNSTGGALDTNITNASISVGGIYNSAAQSITDGQTSLLQLDQLGNIQILNNDKIINGEASQTAVVNNILTTTAGSTSSLVKGYKSATIQVNSTGTAGTYIFEGSNDDSVFTTIPVYNQTAGGSSLAIGEITATATNITYTLPVYTTYIRLRIVSTITGGSIQAFTRLMSTSWINPIDLEAIADSPAYTTDFPSKAYTTTTTTTSVFPAIGGIYKVNVGVTAVTGTSPTLDMVVQESLNGGTSFSTVYTFPQITGTTTLTSTPLLLQGSIIRYQLTIGGTGSPSFTLAIGRLQANDGATSIVGTYNSTQQSLTNGQQAPLQVDAQGNLQTMNNDLIITGASAQTTAGNNALLATAGTSSISTTGYKSGSVQIISTGTAGTYIFEGSNDGTTFVAIPVYDQSSPTGIPIVSAITASVSSIVYCFAITTSFIRLRIATTITGGSIRAHSKLSGSSIDTTLYPIVNLNKSAIITDVPSGTVAASPANVTVTPSFGTANKITLDVTAISGTAPTIQLSIFEIRDGTNAVLVYTMPVVSTVSRISTPNLTLMGSQLRYVVTVGGTGPPSVTYSITRLQNSSPSKVVRQIIASPGLVTTTSAAIPSTQMSIENDTTYVMAIVVVGSTTIVGVHTVRIEGSVDGTNWVTLGTATATLTTNTNFVTSVPTASVSFIRCFKTATTGTPSITITNVTLIAFS